jgi:alanine-glyoxylate transaminase/serine-glyoxylate transaminase/serine-pyruvate transaminase
MAMQAPVVGHLDPYFISLMEDTMGLLRHVFQTRNNLTFPVSGTGSAGMEASFVNFVEPGDVVVIGVNGLFGERMTDVAARCGAAVVPVTAEWGQIIEPEALRAALKPHKKVKIVALVHAETSTGILQPLAEASRLAKEHDALFLVDTVTSLGGHEVRLDEWGVDICYSGTQKCLSCPPGLSPFSAGDRAVAVLQGRKAKVQSWYLDLAMLRHYWDSNRFYHHTAPISMVYALHEALAVVVEEGLEARFARHQQNSDALRAGIEAMGLVLHAQAGYRMNPLTTVRIPAGVDDAKTRQALLTRYSIEIGAGVGPLKGRVWRIGLMGQTSTSSNVLLLLSSLGKLLNEQGFKADTQAAVAAAVQSLNKT